MILLIFINGNRYFYKFAAKYYVNLCSESNRTILKIKMRALKQQMSAVRIGCITDANRCKCMYLAIAGDSLPSAPNYACAPNV